MAPLSLPEFINMVELEHDVKFVEAGDMIVEYQKYLEANSHKYNYGALSIVLWLIVAWYANFSKN